jgi:2-C-methyl-D-erythritol 4-phosphate cytidylyltransferase
LLVQALQRARGVVTDEATALEQLGLKPKLVAGSRENIKVTWPEDLAMADSILTRRAEADR